ncbi:MAG: hypothetical protein NVS3B15_14440 [Sediminibacterium sp.]
MGPDGKKGNMYSLFMQYEIVRNKEKRDIQAGIETAAGSIAESLQGHDLFEQRVKKIHQLQDKLADMFMQLSH